MLAAAPPPAHSARIVIVEDEPAIAESLAYALEREGFRAQIAPTLARAEAELASADLLILDLMLPDGHGGALIARGRQGGQRLPVIVLSSRDAERERVAALESGADDYVTKPFSPREVVARVRAVLRRVPQQETTAPSTLRLDAGARTAHYGTRELGLTRVEFDLLAALWASAGSVRTRTELIEVVWGEGFALTDRTVDSHVKSLRRKLSEAGAASALLETVRGIGFRLTLPSVAAQGEEDGTKGRAGGREAESEG